jgi:hypothetical protein
MRKTINQIFTFFILLGIISCGSNATLDQKVDQVINTTDEEERIELLYQLADSSGFKVVDLIVSKYPNPSAINITERLFLNYQEIIKEDSKEEQRIVNQIKHFVEPKNDSLNEIRINLIAFSLISFEGACQKALINQAKNHGEIALDTLISVWKKNQNSDGLVSAIKMFDALAISKLSDDIVNNSDARLLLAKIGKPAVESMLKKMKDDDQKVRFAAGDVLVDMIKYDAEAVDVLTSAIDNKGISSIAKNYPFYIRLGRSGTEDLLLKALKINFTQEMCVDYLNCGNSLLEDGATKIAADFGYNVTSSFGSHGGPKWRSGN